MTAKTLVFSVLLLTGWIAPLAADDEFGIRASWTPADRAEVREAINQWLATQQLDDLTRLKVDALWPEEQSATASDDLLQDVAVTIALVTSDAQPLVEFCRADRSSPVAPEFEVLTREDTAPFVRDNLRLYYGRWLAQNQLHDEALEQLSSLTVDSVVDPTSLLFYRAVAQHGLLDREKCLASLEKLLENQQAIPRRYASVAQLMTADLKAQRKDKVIKTLDEVARLMADIERRQRLYRAGKRVRKQEEDVIAKLDELIKELEESGGGGGGGTGGGNAPSRPMQDSMPGGGSGPGNVDPRQITPGGDWGDLPPKQREAAIAELAKDLPGHYHEVIKEYFRNLPRTADSP